MHASDRFAVGVFEGFLRFPCICEHASGGMPGFHFPAGRQNIIVTTVSYTFEEELWALAVMTVGKSVPE